MPRICVFLGDFLRDGKSQLISNIVRTFNLIGKLWQLPSAAQFHTNSTRANLGLPKKISEAGGLG